MSKDIKKALEHCIDNECVGCPNNEELGSGDIVCRARLLPEILEYISDLQHKLKVSEIATKLACERVKYFEEMQDREMGFEDLFGYESNYDLQGIIEQYKEQAEKVIKGE